MDLVSLLTSTTSKGNPNAWDISKAFFDAGSQAWETNNNIVQAINAAIGFSVATQETAPHGLFFKPDGTRMYVIGQTGDDVNEYALSIPWIVTSASYVQNFSVSAQESSPTGIFFKPDGTKMYVCGVTGDDVNEYDLSTTWDISTASYLQNFSVATEGTDPTDLFFKSDGTKMYIIDSFGDEVNEYSLSTPWDVSSASYVQNFSVASQDLTPQSLFFKSDGTKMYVGGASQSRLFEYNLSSAWDISTASFPATPGGLSVVGEEGLFFHPSGSAFFIIDPTNDAVSTYAVGLFPVTNEELTPTGLFFKPDGTKMYICGESGDDINEYDLATPWDPTTATYLQVKSVSGQDTSPQSIYFKPDGTAMYMLGLAGVDVNEYSLSVAWDVSTLTYVRNFSVSGQDTGPRGLFFKPDGTKMYVCGTTGDDVNEYDLSTAWNISTASYTQNFSVVADVANPRSVVFKPDGLVMYVYAPNKLVEYYLSSAWDVSTASFNASYVMNRGDSGFYWKEDGESFFFVSDTLNRVIKYSISPT